jgi:hypothetical protein
MIAVSTRRSSQRGFALLIIFLMAATIALMLYRQMPRVAFESERDKEQLLIDRGEQYKRAIQLYVNANRRFPSSIADLEQRDKRFLRRRYKDPYTGKEEWRLIHSNGQYLTDSLVQKPPTANGTQASTAPTTPTDGQQTVNVAILQRPSDRPLTGPGAIGASDPANPAAYPGSQIGDPQNPIFAPMNLQQVQELQRQQQQAGLGAPAGAQPVPPAPGQPLPGQVSGQPTVGGVPILQPGVSPGFQVNANGQIIAVAPNSPNSPVGAPGVTQNAAANLINTLLTTPRPQQPQQASNPALLQNNNNTIGGGIAGVASSHEGPSIKIYNDQQTYQMWEFIGQATGGLAPGGGGGGGGGNGPPRNGPQGTPGANGGPGAPVQQGILGQGTGPGAVRR